MNVMDSIKTSWWNRVVQHLRPLWSDRTLEDSLENRRRSHPSSTDQIYLAIWPLCLLRFRLVCRFLLVTHPKSTMWMLENFPLYPSNHASEEECLRIKAYIQRQDPWLAEVLTAFQTSNREAAYRLLIPTAMPWWKRSMFLIRRRHMLCHGIAWAAFFNDTAMLDELLSLIKGPLNSRCSARLLFSYPQLRTFRRDFSLSLPPLGWACMANHRTMVERLLPRTDSDHLRDATYRMSAYGDVVNVVATLGDPDLIRGLLQHSAEAHRSEVHAHMFLRVTQEGHQAAFDHFLSLESIVNDHVLLWDGLGDAAYGGHLPLVEALTLRLDLSKPTIDVMYESAKGGHLNVVRFLAPLFKAQIRERATYSFAFSTAAQWEHAALLNVLKDHGHVLQPPHPDVHDLFYKVLFDPKRHYDLNYSYDRAQGFDYLLTTIPPNAYRDAHGQSLFEVALSLATTKNGDSDQTWRRVDQLAFFETDTAMTRKACEEAGPEKMPRFTRHLEAEALRALSSTVQTNGGSSLSRVRL